MTLAQDVILKQDGVYTNHHNCKRWSGGGDGGGRGGGRGSCMHGNLRESVK